MEIFGERNYDLEYKKRYAVYGVIQNEQGQFLCVKDLDGNYFLVGGGIEDGESPESALLRESIEETGYKIQIVEFIGNAQRHWVSKKYPNDSQRNIATLYVCKLLEKIAEPIESETMCWIGFNELEENLFHEHHLYLMKQHLNIL